MDETALCPRCRTPLAADTAVETALRCAACQGLFLPASDIRDDLLSQATVVEKTVQTGGTPADSIAGAPPAECPQCRQALVELRLGEAVLDRCPACRGVWLDAGEQLTADRPADAPLALSRYLLYSLSLPERAVRSTVGLAAGAVQEAATLLVPQAFQSAKSYEIIVRNSLRFLVQDIGGVAGDPQEQAGPDNYLARKAVGNFVDLAGFATLHISPLWIMAIVSDLAYGSQTYVLELARELEDKGLIDDTSTIHHVDDILEAVRNASGEVATTFDTPPLSVDELKKTLDNTRTAIGSADYTRILPESELNAYWQEMRQVAAKEDVGLIGVSAALTMHTLGKVKTVSHGTLTGIEVVGGLFNRHVIGHYVDSLNTVREKGFYQTLQDSAAPYIEAVWNNFAVNKETWTEEFVTGRMFGKAYQAVKNWFTGSAGKPDSIIEEPPPQTPSAGENGS